MSKRCTRLHAHTGKKTSGKKHALNLLPERETVSKVHFPLIANMAATNSLCILLYATTQRQLVYPTFLCLELFYIGWVCAFSRCLCKL
jgi:hypothetical protein